VLQHFRFASRSPKGRAYRTVCSHSLDRQRGFHVVRRPVLKEHPITERCHKEKRLRESNWPSSWSPRAIGRRRTTTRSFARSAACNAHDHFALLIEKRENCADRRACSGRRYSNGDFCTVGKRVRRAFPAPPALYQLRGIRIKKSPLL